MSIVLDNGKYEIVYDITNSFPEKVLRNGQEWRNVIGDNLIFFLCSEIENLKKQRDWYENRYVPINI